VPAGADTAGALPEAGTRQSLVGGFVGTPEMAEPRVRCLIRLRHKPRFSGERRLPDSRRPPEEAREALTVIEDVSRGALRDMRATLKVLRREQEGDTQDLRPVLGLSDLPALVRTAEAAGVHVDLRSRCADEPPDGVALSAFRIVQEALTNVIKHAAPTHCRVQLTAERNTLTIDVADEGPGPGQRPTVPGGGMGLVGMKERVAAHGGTLSAGPQPGGGFQVLVTLPY
jgi:signal transduction histidine kinase